MHLCFPVVLGDLGKGSFDPQRGTPHRFGSIAYFLYHPSVLTEWPPKAIFVRKACGQLSSAYAFTVRSYYLLGPSILSHIFNPSTWDVDRRTQNSRWSLASEFKATFLLDSASNTVPFLCVLRNKSCALGSIVFYTAVWKLTCKICSLPKFYRLNPKGFSFCGC